MVTVQVISLWGFLTSLYKFAKSQLTADADATCFWDIFLFL